MTTGLVTSYLSVCLFVDDEDGLHRADIDRGFDVRAFALVGLCGVFELVVVVELEDVGSFEYALAVVLALVHVDFDFDGHLLLLNG
jgi:hypothetical protein